MRPVAYLPRLTSSRKESVGATKIKIEESESLPITANKQIEALLRCRPTARAATSTTYQASPADYTIPFKLPGTPDELQLLHYFNVEAAVEVSGFPTVSFWNNKVLCRMVDEPAIRQAVLALSICHHKAVVDRTPTAKWQETSSPTALHQYNKAIRQLREYLANNPQPSKEVVVTCCIIFYSVEILRQEYGTAIQHMDGGLVLLREWMGRQVKSKVRPRNSGEDVHSLITTFCRLDIGVGRIENSVGELPNPFDNIEQSLVAFDTIRIRVIQFAAAKNKVKFAGQDVNSPTLSTTELGIQKGLDHWSNNIRALIAQLRPTAGINRDRLVSIRLQYQCLSILFQISKSSTKEGSIELDSSLRRVLQACETLELKQISNEVTSGVEVPTTLLLLAMTTQEASIKSRALQLIQRWPTIGSVLEGQKLARLMLSIML
ncbi:hypothetical protein BP6252_05813 [Coleophoma cylindrospora]|uniref:Uncharacterized protein n=1 Tax=Coleophoma cylindrospora TaxID=1849047 RepID=A0A3D8RUY8_9HELO|nr:hypothetical protein BP6252_05813 [Coleophoma cylindrospora]